MSVFWTVPVTVGLANIQIISFSFPLPLSFRCFILFAASLCWGSCQFLIQSFSFTPNILHPRYPSAMLSPWNCLIHLDHPGPSWTYFRRAVKNLCSFGELKMAAGKISPVDCESDNLFHFAIFSLTSLQTEPLHLPSSSGGSEDRTPCIKRFWQMWMHSECPSATCPGDSFP